MKFKNMTLSKDIDAAIIQAERMFHPQSQMMLAIMRKNDFEYDSGTGYEVYQKIISCGVTAPVFTYRPLNPFSRALGYSDSVGIHINSKKFNSMSLETLALLLCHEWLHFGPKFGHGNNFPSEYKNNHSVNYFVSSKKWS